MAGCRIGERGPVKPIKPIQRFNVVGQSPQGQNQVVGVELSRWQALQVQVAFELAMELFRCGMVFIEFNNALVVMTLFIKRGPPTLQRYLGNQQELAFLVNVTFGNPERRDGWRSSRLCGNRE